MTATPARSQARSTPHRHLTVVKDSPPDLVPPLRTTQTDAEAMLKCRSIVAMVEGGFLTPAEAWPWVRREVII